MKKTISVLTLLIILILSSFNLVGNYTRIKREGVSIKYPSNWNIIEAKGYALIVSEKAPSKILSVLTNFVIEIDTNFNDLEKYSIKWKKDLIENEMGISWEIVSENNIIYKKWKLKSLFSPQISPLLKLREELS